MISPKVITLIFIVYVSLTAGDKSFPSYEFDDDDEKTPYDFVKDRLDKLGPSDAVLPAANGYEVEEEHDYEEIEPAASNLYNGAIGQLGLGGLGLGTVGNLGLGAGVGVGGIGLSGVGLGGVGLGGVGLGAGVSNGIGLIHPGTIGLTNGVGGVGNGLIYQPIFGLHGAQIGGGYVDKKAYEAAQKKADDENLEKLTKKAEEEVKHGEEGYQQGSIAATAAKGDSGYYKDEEAKKNAAGDEKYYEGSQKLDKAGANEQAHKVAKSHKKGHVSKGYKTSSIKNEEEKTESFYDEAHDEADHKNLGHNAGSFGENSASGFKGQHEHKVLDAASAGKEGHHVSEHKADDSKGNKGGYAQSGYKGGAEQVEKFNNLGAHSVHGHQESASQYQQNKPYGILPIHA